MTQDNYKASMDFLLNIATQMQFVDIPAMEELHGRNDSIGILLYPTEWMRQREGIKIDKSLIDAARPLYNWLQKQKAIAENTEA